MRLRWKIAQAAEIRWWQNYLKQKDPRTYLTKKKAYWKTIVEQSGVQVGSSDRILDAGCGPAGIFLLFEQQEVVAIDPLLDSYQNKLPIFKPSIHPNIKFQQIPLENFQDEKNYDKIFCLNVINHVDQLDQCLDRLVAALHQNGEMVLSVDVHRSNFLKRIFQAIPGDVLHPHQYSLSDYKAKMVARNCTLIREKRLKAGGIFDYYLMVWKK